jgi:GntR family transcriptional regulator
MEIKLDFRLGTPIYVQIMEQIKQHIASGELEPGDQLPTVRQMAADLRVNFNTIARAYRLLDESGIISTQHGRGTYIAEEITLAATAQLRRHALEELTHRYLVEAAQLEFFPEDVEAAFERYVEAWKSNGVPPGETLYHE